MPIILLWNETVEGALPQFRRWLTSFERSSFLIERWLEKRVKEAEELDRLTTRFPVFRFYNQAVTATVTRLQFGALLTEPVPGIGAHMERALARWDVGRRTRAAVRETQLLPELLRVFEEISGAVLASIDRFRRPTAAMFDPTRRRLQDIPGLAVLAFRAVATSGDQIVRAATNVRDAFAPREAEGGGSRGAMGRGTGVVASEGAAASVLPFHHALDNILRFAIAGLLVIPALARLIGTIGADLLLHVRYLVLGIFRGIERQAFDFRRRILEVFVYNLDAYARQGLVFVLTAKEMAVSYIQFYAQVGIEYLRGMVAGVGVFAAQMEDFWVGLTTVIGKVVRFGNAVVSIDVGPVLHRGFEAIEDAIETIDSHLYEIGESPEEYDAPDEFRVTIEELVMDRGAGSRANRELTRAVGLLRDAWVGADPIGAAINAGVIHRLTGYHIPNLIGALLMLTRDAAGGPFGSVGALRLPRAGAPTQPTLTFDASTVPDLTARIITPLRDGVTRAVHRGVTGVAVAIEGVVVAAVDTLDSTAVAFDVAAERASHMGSLRILGRLTSNTDALMDSLFGDQEVESSETGLEPVAGAYAQWLIQGGFDMVGAAAAGFIGMVLDEWLVHLQENTDTPVEITATSPRRLLERARLGRVHTPRITVVARGEHMSRGLAARIADGFQQAVQEAYSSGQGRFDALLAAAPAATP
jgi:hypothetical protein